MVWDLKNVLLCFIVLINLSIAGSITGIIQDDNGAGISGALVDTGSVYSSTGSGSVGSDIVMGSSVCSGTNPTLTYDTFVDVDTIDYTLTFDTPLGPEIYTGELDEGNTDTYNTVYNGELQITLDDVDDITGDIQISYTYYRRSITDASGNFRIDCLDTGNYNLYVSASGYQSSSYGPIQIIHGDPVKGDRTLPIPIVLYPSGGTGDGSIAGHVINTSGQDIAGATVTAYLSGSPAGTDTTDASGNFNISVSASGTYSIQVVASGYHSGGYNGIVVDVTNPLDDHVTLPSDIVLSPIGATTNLWGYVDNNLGNAVVGALINVTKTDGSPIGTDTTDADGFYNVSGIEVGIPFNVYVSASGYYNTSVNNLALPTGGLEYNFTITSTGGTPPITYGNVEGYVFGASSNPLNSATVTCAGVSNTTNSSGYYILYNVTSGTQTISASRNGYDGDSATIDVIPYSTVEYNFTLSEETNNNNNNNDNNNNNGGNNRESNNQDSSNLNNHVSSGNSSLNVDGCNVEISREVDSSDGETRVTLTIYTDDCNASPFELREHIPQSLSSGDVSSTLSPDDVYENPFTLIWKFESGLNKGQVITIIYTIDVIKEDVDENDFYARVYSLVSSINTNATVKRGNLIVTGKAFVGDKVTIRFVTDDGDPIPNVKITIITPYGYEMTVVTDDDGKAIFQPASEGVYSYRVDGYIIKRYMQTTVSEKQQTNPMINVNNSHQSVNVNTSSMVNESPNGLLANMLTDAGDNIGIVGVIVVLLVAIVGVVVYAWNMNIPSDKVNSEEHGNKENDEESDKKSVVSEKTIVIETGKTAKKQRVYRENKRVSKRANKRARKRK